MGLYRSSDHTIVRNRMDYNVRGYSHGWYRRGQDSAALLIYEQSMRNTVALRVSAGRVRRCTPTCRMLTP